MTRQNRSHLLIIALVPVVVFAAVRCADSSVPSAPAAAPTASAATAPLAARLTKLHEETDWIGKFHNDALRYVFTSLSRIPVKARSKRNICETARRAYAEFHLSRRGTPVPASVDAQIEGVCVGGASASVRSASVGTTAGTRRRDISPAAQTLMDQMADAIDGSTSFDDLNSRVSSIESEAASTLSYDEAADVFTLGSVALNSATYWANNVTEWVPFTNTADYSVLMSTRISSPRAGLSPAFNNGDDSGGSSSFSWGDFANQVWNDTKAAAKRAAFGDVKAGGKAIMSAALIEAPVVVDIVLSSAAVGSISAVLML